MGGWMMIVEPEEGRQDLQEVNCENDGIAKQTPVSFSSNRRRIAKTAIVSAIVALLVIVAVPAFQQTTIISREMLRRNNLRQVRTLKRFGVTVNERPNGTLEKVPGLLELTALADSYFQACDRGDFDEALRIKNSREFKWGVAAADYFRLRSEMDPLVTQDDLTTLEAMTGIQIESHGDLYVAMKRSSEAREFVYSGINLMEEYPESIKSLRLKPSGDFLDKFPDYVLYMMTLGKSERFDKPSQVGMVMGIAVLILVIAIMRRRIISAVKRRRRKPSVATNDTNKKG